MRRHGKCPRNRKNNRIFSWLSKSAGRKYGCIFTGNQITPQKRRIHRTIPTSPYRLTKLPTIMKMIPRTGIELRTPIRIPNTAHTTMNMISVTIKFVRFPFSTLKGIGHNFCNCSNVSTTFPYTLLYMKAREFASDFLK